MYLLKCLMFIVIFICLFILFNYSIYFGWFWCIADISTYNLELFEPKDKSPSTPFIVSVLHKRVSGKVTDVVWLWYINNLNDLSDNSNLLTSLQLENYSYSHDGQVTITNTHKHKNGKVSINTEVLIICIMQS